MLAASASPAANRVKWRSRTTTSDRRRSLYRRSSRTTPGSAAAACRMASAAVRSQTSGRPSMPRTPAQARISSGDPWRSPCSSARDPSKLRRKSSRRRAAQAPRPDIPAAARRSFRASVDGDVRRAAARREVLRSASRSRARSSAAPTVAKAQPQAFARLSRQASALRLGCGRRFRRWPGGRPRIGGRPVAREIAAWRARRRAERGRGRSASASGPASSASRSSSSWRVADW
jgi:hypothetical protein